jgi:hypothetical protein
VSDPWAEFTQPAEPPADPWADFAITAPAPQQVAPSTPGSRFRAGLVDYAHGGAQLLANSLPSGVVEGVNNAAGWLNRQPVIGPVTQALGITPATPQQLNSQVRQREAEQEAAYRAELQQPEGELPTNWARIGGRVVPGVVAALATRNPQTLTGAIGQGAVMGAGQGAMEPVAAPEGEYWGEVGRNAGLGGITGGVGGGAGYAVGRLVSGAQNARPGARELHEAGVRMTPGQIMGGALQRTEDRLASVPFVGDQIRDAQRNSVISLNRATANRVLEPLRETVPDSIPVGRSLLSEVDDRISAAYQRVLPRVQSFGPDAQFQQDLIGAGQHAITPESQRAYVSIMRNGITPRAGATLDGETWKQIDTQLGFHIREYMGSQDPIHRETARALQHTQLAFRELLERTNPTVATEVRAANSAFARFIRMESAGGGQGAREGVFSGPQLSAAVRQADRTNRHNAFARGDALMQDLGDAAATVLPSTVPNSGTADRMLLAGLLNPAAGFAGAGAAGMLNPWAAAAGAGAYGAYSGPGSRALQAAILAQRPAGVQAVGRALARGGVGAGGAIPLADLLLAPPQSP